MSYTSNERIKNSQARFVRISSEDKVIGSNSQFVVNLESSGGAIDNVKGFIVHSIECPNVFDNITETNNNFFVGFGGPATETDLDIDIPVGYYLIDDLITLINAIVATQIAINGDAYTLVLSKVGVFPNERIQFLANGLSAGSCNLFTKEDSIFPTLGVLSTANALTPPDFVLTNGIPVVANAIPNLIGETAVYVHSRTLCPLNLSEGSGTFSVVDKLNLDQPYGSTCYSNFNNDITHQKSYFPFESKKTLRKIDITLRNRTGQILQLPFNFNFSMMIKIFHT
jgi:hypothetical protein